MSFEVINAEDYDKFLVNQKETDWFFPLESEIQASELCKKLNEIENLYDSDDPETIDELYILWNKYINELTSKERELLNNKETYAQMEQTIIAETNFKALYGKNNETVRKTHCRNELKDLIDERHDLELRINYLKRRIHYIKSLMSMQETLLKYRGNQI